MLKTVIIDDEIASLDSLEIFLNSIDSEVTVVGKASNIDDAEKIIIKTNPDLVFLDIEMPQGSGFELLDRIEKVNFHVIFITAFNQYALKAFKYSAIDYILKPIDINSLQDAIGRVEALNNNISQNYATLKENLKEEFPQKLAIPTQETIEVVKTKDIIQFEADGNYTKVYIKDRTPIIVSKSLGEYDDILKNDIFYRCHKSHLINLEHIKKIIKVQNKVIMDNDTEALISRRRKQEFLNTMQEFLEA